MAAALLIHDFIMLIQVRLIPQINYLIEKKESSLTFSAIRIFHSEFSIFFVALPTPTFAACSLTCASHPGRGCQTSSKRSAGRLCQRLHDDLNLPFAIFQPFLPPSLLLKK